MRVASDSERERLSSITVRNTESAAGELIFKLSATILQFDYGFELHISAET